MFEGSGYLLTGLFLFLFLNRVCRWRIDFVGNWYVIKSFSFCRFIRRVGLGYNVCGSFLAVGDVFVVLLAEFFGQEVIV